MGKKPIASVTYESKRISLKKKAAYLTLIIFFKMCVTPFLCGPRANLWSIYGL